MVDCMAGRRRMSMANAPRWMVQGKEVMMEDVPGIIDASFFCRQISTPFIPIP